MDEMRLPQTICNYCNRVFVSEKKLQEHQTMKCKIKPLVDSGMLSIGGGAIPGKIRLTDSERDNVICKLLYDTAVLKMELCNVKSQLSTLKRKQGVQIVRTLNNDSTKKPKQTIQQWLQNIPISVSNVSHICHKSIGDAIKQVFLDGLNMAINTKVPPPIVAYHEKPLKLYTYGKTEDGTTKWSSCDATTVRKYCTFIATRFLQIYVANESYFLDTNLEEESMLNQKMENFNKVMDSSYKYNDYISNLTDKIYNHIKEKWPYDIDNETNNEE